MSAAYVGECAANIRRNVRKALAVLTPEESEAVHDYLVHIDTIAQQIETEVKPCALLSG